MNKGTNNQGGMKESSAALTLANETGKDNTTMSIEQLNEYLVDEATKVCRYIRKLRGTQGYISDIVPPISSVNWTLKHNIKNVMACFSNTLGAALFAERGYISKFREFETLSATISSEKNLIYDFLSENGLSDKFNTYVYNKQNLDKK